jgi:hypothetical protein
LLSDISFLFGLLLLGVAGIYGLLRRGRRWVAWVAGVLLIVPPLLVAARTAYRYALGSARLTWPSGQVTYRELYNLDPRYRAFVEPRWREQLAERWSADIQQQTLFWLIQRFGWMRGSYLGPYPQREQVRARLLETSYRGKPSELASAFPIGDRTIQVRDAVLHVALVDADREQLAAGGPQLQVALIDPNCLVVGYWGARAYHAELLDLSGFGWFAHYVYFDYDEPLPPRL